MAKTNTDGLRLDSVTIWMGHLPGAGSNKAAAWQRAIEKVATNCKSVGIGGIAIMLNEPPGAGDKWQDFRVKYQDGLVEAYAEGMEAAGLDCHLVTWLYDSTKQPARADKYARDAAAYLARMVDRYPIKSVQLDAEGEWLDAAGDEAAMVRDVIAPAFDVIKAPVGITSILPTKVRKPAAEPLVKWVMGRAHGGYIVPQGYSFTLPAKKWSFARGMYPDVLQKNIAKAFVAIGAPIDRQQMGLAVYGNPHKGYTVASELLTAIESTNAVGIYDAWLWSYGHLFKNNKDAKTRRDIIRAVSKGGRFDGGDGIPWGTVAGVVTVIGAALAGGLAYLKRKG